MENVKPKLTYFQGMGRAEITRLCFRIGGVDFEDNRLSFEEFGTFKKDPNSFVWKKGFGSVPILEHGDFFVAQSIACAFYAQDIALKGTELTPKQRATDAMFLGTWQDVQSAMYKCLFGNDDTKKAGLEALPAAVEKFMGGLEQKLPENGFVNGRDIPSLADLVCYNLVKSAFPGTDQLKQDTSKFKRLTALVEAVGKLKGTEQENKFSITSTQKLHDGNDFPRFGLGTFDSEDGDQVKNAVKMALDNGYRHIDTAIFYMNEASIGEAIAKHEVDRKDIFITSKIWGNKDGSNFGDFDYYSVGKGVDQTLKFLQTDYIDLFLMHWPLTWDIADYISYWGDPALSGNSLCYSGEVMKLGTLPEVAYHGKLDEEGMWTNPSGQKMLKKYDNKAGRAAGWKGMVEAKKSGKCRSIGVSNFTIRHLLEIKAMGLGMPTVNQVEMNAFYQQPELKAFCDSENIILTAYAPLTAPGLTKGKFLKDQRLIAIGKKHNKTPAQILIRWCLQQGVTVIPKTVSEGRMKENCSVFDFELDEEDLMNMKNWHREENRNYNYPYLV